MHRWLVALIFCSSAFAGETASVMVQSRRVIPEGAERPANFPERSEREVSLKHTGCDGVAALKSLDHLISVEAKGNTIVVRGVVEPAIEKLRKGPLHPPSLVIVHDKSDSPVTMVLERSMASDRWEAGGEFREALDSPNLVDAKFWKSVELRCSAESPYHAAVVPEDVKYIRMDDDALAAAVARIDGLLRGPAGFAATELYDDLVLIGPGLFPGLEGDPALREVRSPTVVTMDPVTKVSRKMLRIQGRPEFALFGQAMRRYLGEARLRIRAATAAELAEFWLNIGWDIEEPLLIAEYGKHRLVLDVDENQVIMVDELHQ